MPGPNKNFGDINADKVGSETNPQSVYASDISTVYDSLINTASGLENISPSDGETIAVAQPATPYEISSWVDIDGVNNVTLHFASAFAEDGNPIIKVADNADVGGIRVGSSAHCDNVTIINHGHDGNHPNQDQSVKRLHGLIFDDVTDFTLEGNNYYTRTSPYHEHDSGGAAITVRQAASQGLLGGTIRIHDIGDRGIQCGGIGVDIRGVHSTDGYDRAVALDYDDSGGTNHGAEHCTVTQSWATNHTSGSAFGGEACLSCSIDNVTAFDTYHRLFSFTNARDCHFQGVARGGARQGVRATGCSDTYFNVVIRDHPNREGIKLENCDRCSVDMKVRDVASTVTSAEPVAVRLIGCQDVRLSGHILNPTRYGVNNETSTGTVIEGLTVDSPFRAGVWNESGDMKINGLEVINASAGGANSWPALQLDAETIIDEVSVDSGDLSDVIQTSTSPRVVVRGAELDPTSVTGDYYALDPSHALVSMEGADPVPQDDLSAVGGVKVGQTWYHSGATGTEGPAFWNGSDWTSLVDGTAI